MSRSKSTHPVLVLLIAALLSTEAVRATTLGGCVDDVTESFFPSRVPTNCTANDVTFVLVGLGVQDDGCTDASDTVSIRLRAIVENTTAQTRYDIGMYVATDGGDALRGSCAREDIAPVGGVGVTTCGVGALDLDGPLSGVDNNAVGVGDGDYLNGEKVTNNSTPDACGDLNAEGQAGCDEDGDGLWDDSVVDFDTPVSLPCNDSEDDGFVNLSTCATWGNHANGVHDGTGGETCDSEDELVPETKAKCRCEQDFNSDIPKPNLSCTASCTPSTIQPGETTTCTVTYANGTPAACVPDPGTPERFQCGTAGFMRFKTDIVEEVSEMTDFGDFSSVSATCLMGGCTTSLVDTDGMNGDDQIVWTPDSSVGTTAIIGPGDGSSMTFDYTLDAGAPADRTLTFRTTGYWANDSTFSPEVAQTTLTCSGFLTTPVTLSSFSTRRKGGTTIAEWTTATEIQNAGFNLYEELEDGWRRVNDELIPSRAIDSTVPHRYRFGFSSLGDGQLYIESVDLDGAKHLHGPFTPGEAHGVRPRSKVVDWQRLRSEAKSPGNRSVAVTERSLGGRRATAVDLLVDRDGLYRVTHEELAAAGFDFSRVPAAYIALLSRGQPVPVRVEPAAGSKRFGPGGFVEFYGEALDTLYTSTHPYRLTVNPAAAQRVAVDDRSAKGPTPAFYMEKLRVERDRAYSFASRTGDPWYDTRMLVYESPRQWPFDLEVEDYYDGSQGAVLTVDLWGSTDWAAEPDHHVRVSLNGTLLADRRFDGLTRRTLRLQVPPGVLFEGTNQLTLELPADLGVDYDLISLESYSLIYPRAFRARDGGLSFRASGNRLRVFGLPGEDVVIYRLGRRRPARLRRYEVEPEEAGFSVLFRGSRYNARYVVATSATLLTPELREVRPAVDITGGEAEYLMISHSAFLDQLTPLMALHESQGLSVRAVDVADIYAQFGYGIFDPEAIRAYIRHAAESMGTRFVLLVGADTFDYHDNLGIGSMSFVPTLYAATGEIVSFAPVDPLYTDLDGDMVPDLPLGRFPVRSIAELDSLISKTLEYAAKDYAGTGIFAADQFDSAGGFSFTRESEEFLRELHGDWTVDRAYLDRLDLDGARETLIGRMNEGAALTSYIGHSGPTAWTFSGLLTTTDAEALTNLGRPTVVVQWGCWNNYHVEPRFESLGNALLLSGDHGAAAVLGSATLLETTSARALSDYLAPRLARPGVRLGEALAAAKQELGQKQPELRDVLLGWTILGDPALFVEP
jgi:hypothetical protein